MSKKTIEEIFTIAKVRPKDLEDIKDINFVHPNLIQLLTLFRYIPAGAELATFSVRGTTFSNPEDIGTIYDAVSKKEPVIWRIRPEPENPKDKLAVAIDAEYQGKSYPVGYMPSEIARACTGYESYPLAHTTFNMVPAKDRRFKNAYHIILLIGFKKATTT